jgi:hypothetical protein
MFDTIVVMFASVVTVVGLAGLVKLTLYRHAGMLREKSPGAL